MQPKRDFSGKSHLAFIILCVITCVGIMAACISLYMDKFEQHLGTETRIRLKETAQYGVEHITTVVEETQKKLHAVAVAMSQLGGGTERKLVYLRQVSREAGFAYMGYAGLNGELHATIASASEYVGDEDWYKAALNDKEFISDYVRKIFQDRAARGILLSVPIISTGVRPMPEGALVAMIESRRLQEAIDLQSFGGEGYAYIINRAGLVIMRTRSLDFDNIYLAWKDRRFAEGFSLNELRQAVTADKNGMIVFFNAGGQRQYLYHHALPFNNWTLINVVPETAVASDQLRIIRDLGIFASFIFLMFGAAVAYAVYSYWQAYRSHALANAKSAFLSSMSHEIRTPLNGLIGLNYLMRANVDNRKKMLGYLSQSESTAEYLLSLINDILDINKLDADKMEMAHKPFSLEHLIATMESIFSSILRSKNINFIVKSQIPFPFLIGDEVRFKQVLTNILGNASKFTPAGGTITIETAQLEKSADEVITDIVITDTGCGMTQEFLERIFDAFSQERSKCSNGSEGTGLGMAISYQLMQKMGGSITVTSELGYGSQFNVQLPAKKCAECEVSPVSEIVSRPHIRLGNMEVDGDDLEKDKCLLQELHILVADDNELNRELLQEILEMHGMRVTVACDGLEAVEIFAKSAPGEFDVILMDMLMPKLDGTGASRNIRAMKRDDAASVIIYACTANSFEEDREKCMLAGMNGFLAKPVDVRELIEKLEQCINIQPQ